MKIERLFLAVVLMFSSMDCIPAQIPKDKNDCFFGCAVTKCVSGEMKVFIYYDEAFTAINHEINLYKNGKIVTCSPATGE